MTDPNAYAIQDLAVDNLTSVKEIADRLRYCGADSSAQDPINEPQGSAESFATVGTEVAELGTCPGALYFWSPLMPLSGLGMRDAAAAADRIGVPLAVVAASTLYEGRVRLRGQPRVHEDHEVDAVRVGDRRGALLVRRLIAAGASVHYPAVLVYRDSGLVGTAILGYKTADAYEVMIRERLAASAYEAVPTGSRLDGDVAREDTDGKGIGGGFADEVVSLGAFRDYTLEQDPGAYFRRLPNRVSSHMRLRDLCIC